MQKTKRKRETAVGMNQRKKIVNFLQSLQVWGIFLWFIVLPQSIITFYSGPEWFARMLAISLVVLPGPFALLWWCLHPKSEIIPGYAKLSRPGYEKSKKVSERLIRLLGVILALALLYLISIPLTKDLLDLNRGGSIKSVKGHVSYKAHSVHWWLNQSVRLDDDRLGHSYTLFYYSASRLEKGDTVTLHFLPQSRLVLDVEIEEPE